MRPLPLIAALLHGCSDGRPAEDTAEDTAEDNNAAINCEMSWSEVNGIQVDPITCLGWSVRSAVVMTWHEAVSAGETSHTDDSETDYCADLSEGGRDDWRLPDAATLENLSTRAPPLDELDGDLWSTTTDTALDDLAWTVELSNPGLSLLLSKDSETYARCIVGE